MREKQSFLHGALILTAAILLVKGIGAFFKVPLTWMIGEEGLGYFNTAYNFYSPLYSLSTAGFPIAISRLVSENCAVGRFRDVRQIHRASVFIFLATGTAGSLAMLAGAPLYVTWIGSPGALPSMLLLAPAILFSCLTAIYRGYYEGLRNMYPTALSEVTEALCKLAVGLSGASFAAERWREKPEMLPYAAAAAVLGVSVGSLVSWMILLFRHRSRGDGITREELRSSPPPLGIRRTVGRLAGTAVPIGIGALAVNVAGFVDTTFLQTRIRDVMERSPRILLGQYPGMFPDSVLQTGNVPNFLFGCFSMALTLFMLIPSVTQAIGVSALPSVTTAWTQGKKAEIKRSMEAVLRAAALFSIPAGMGMMVLSGPVVRLVFGDRASAPITSRVLIVLGMGAVFASLSTPLNSMLQAIGRVDLPVKLLIGGLIVKIVLNYFLVGIPEINLMGAGAGTLVCYLMISILAFEMLKREAKVRLDLVSVFVKPLLASSLCAESAYFVQSFLARFISDRAATVAAIAAAALIYAAALLFLRALGRDDLFMLPKGQKIVKILEKHHWIG